MPIKQLKSNELFRRCDPAQFDFKTTSELEDLTEVIGQPRAVDAVKFGMGIQRKGYNLFALGPAGMGKHSLVQSYATDRAETEPVSPDWCYVNNFSEPRKPCMLCLPSGQGVTLAKDMEQLIEDLHATLPAVFESDEYHTRSREIDEELTEREEQEMKAIQQNAEKKNITLIRTPGGFTLAPIYKGDIIGPEEFERLPEKERKRIERDTEELQEQLRKIFHEAPKRQKAYRDRVSDLNREMSASAVSHHIDTLRNKYEKLPAVVAYLDQVEIDVIKNFRRFLRDEGKEKSISFFGLELQTSDEGTHADNRYRVNTFVTNENQKGAPVIYEDQPSYNNLIGRVEHRAELGALVTDFTMVRSGALHRANGGYLILDALKILMQPYAWEGLKRALQAGEIRIESLAQLTSMISTISVEPEPIPLDVKVILIGERYLYYLLSYFDPEFDELFKVAVDFDDQMDRDAESHQHYARLIGTMVRKEELCHFDPSAVARAIEHSSRKLEDSEKLATHMRSLADLLRESDYWASQNNHTTVEGTDVQQAIDNQIHRVDRIRERIQEAIQRGILFIDTDGSKKGQVNGLSVLDLGGFTFGQPTRITARVRMGENQVVDIEREVELGGPIHSKGVFILTAYLGARYTSERPLALSASLVFEQSYSEVEGDSASSAELYALLSALADAPILQSLAVTGSINQRGEIQPIGGVNEKIEGFFDTCSVRGLTGDQGVIIPASNVSHLMLREDVRDAVEAGKFSIYAVDTVDDGIEILTGIPAGQRDKKGQFPKDSINRRVEDTLNRFSERMQAFIQGKTAASKNKKSS
ncbi:MAG: ATP-binding protein [Pseudomonadota bacterium]